MRQFFAGCTAGVVASSLLTPLEVVKTRLQSSTATRMRLDRLLSHVMRTEGLAGLWRGVGINVLGVAPARAVHFSAYNFFKTQAGEKLGVHGPMQHFLAGALASCSAATGEARGRRQAASVATSSDSAAPAMRARNAVPNVPQ